MRAVSLFVTRASLVYWLICLPACLPASDAQVADRENVSYDQYVMNIVTIIMRSTHLLAVSPCKLLDPVVSLAPRPSPPSAGARWASISAPVTVRSVRPRCG